MPWVNNKDVYFNTVTTSSMVAVVCSNLVERKISTRGNSLDFVRNKA